jgi:predicted transposase YdaD
LKSDHWFYRVFQALPDLIRWLPANDSDSGSGFADQGLAAAGQGLLEAGEDNFYRFSAPELKALSHRLDGLLWPRDSASGSEALPVVILEVQMHPDPVFHHRLAAETFRFLQQQPQVRHLRVVVLLAHGRLNLGPSQPAALGRFLTEEVAWVDLEALCRQQSTDPLLALLTIPLRPEPELSSCCQEILALRPELLELILPMLVERFAELSTEQIMVITGIPLDDLRHTRAFQEILSEGRQEGQRQEAAALTLRQLDRRCGPLLPATRAAIEALELVKLETLAEELLDFTGAADLLRWLELQQG